ncbi:putative ribonuclease H-like domain-containing protein, partial [Tanacetum coccineum]
MVPRAVLMKSGLVSINTAKQNISKTALLINTARQVNAAHSKTTVNVARAMSYLSKLAHSTVKRPIHKNTTFKNSNINQRVNTVRGKKINTASPKGVVNAVKGNNFNDVKASARKAAQSLLIENLVDHKIKVIRCDNGTKFKNREMNLFCDMKGILRQFSIAKTPQQNGVAERRNRTLIEAARNMLANSKLPTTFWAEA